MWILTLMGKGKRFVMSFTSREEAIRWAVAAKHATGFVLRYEGVLE